MIHLFILWMIVIVIHLFIYGDICIFSCMCKCVMFLISAVMAFKATLDTDMIILLVSFFGFTSIHEKFFLKVVTYFSE